MDVRLVSLQRSKQLLNTHASLVNDVVVVVVVTLLVGHQSLDVVLVLLQLLQADKRQHVGLTCCWSCFEGLKWRNDRRDFIASHVFEMVA